MKPLVFLLLAATIAPRFDITDARGKKPSGVSIEAGESDVGGWFALRVVNKGKGNPLLIWPFDDRAKMQDGPGEIQAIMIEKADPKALSNSRIVAAVAAGNLLGFPHETGLDAAALAKAIEGLATAEDPFAKGVGLMVAKKPAEAAEPLGRALKERERQLTRVPSEVYPAAILYGQALLGAGKFDEAAVAFLKALKQRPGDSVAKKLRSEALAKAGKPEAQ